jgi:hypothetical protein
LDASGYVVIAVPSGVALVLSGALVKVLFTRARRRGRD